MKNLRRIGGTAALLATVLVLGALVSACGTDSPTGATVATVSAPASNATTVGMSNCTTCHATTAGYWKLGKHANMDDGSLDGAGNPTLAFIETQADPAKCLSCHDALGDGRTQLVNGYTGNVPRPVVGCESCHGGGSEHSGAGPISRTAAATSGTGTALQSSEFNTCTATCHLTYGNDSFTLTTHGVDRTMEKHAAVPGDTRRNTGTGALSSLLYYVKKADEKSCTVCHSAHKNSADLNKEYAGSGHGDTTAGPWIGGSSRRDWKDATNFYCQRCHTATGFKNLNDSLRSGGTYSAFENDYSYLYQGENSSVGGTLSGQNEALYCWACHTDTRGTIRNPGPVTLDYGFFDTTPKIKYSTVSVTFPDLGGSNVCVPCHAGRLTGDTLKSLPEAGSPTFSFANASFINDHDFAGGGTVLGSAYEFTGREYTNPIVYAHDKIGTSGAPGTGSNGPCAGCHMSADKKHLFMPVYTSSGHVWDPVLDSRATITGIATTVCSTCHGVLSEAAPMSAAMLEEQAALRDDAAGALGGALELRGLFFRGNVYPQRDGTILRNGGSTARGLVSLAAGTTVATAVTTNNWDKLNIANGSKLRVYSGDNVVSYTSYTIVSAGPTTMLLDPATTPLTTTFTNAAYAIEKPETVQVTNGSTLVTGVSTSWTQTSVAVGDYFRVDADGEWYPIASRTATTLTLTAVYTGATASGAAYTIIPSSSSTRIKNWLTGTDTDVNGDVTGRNNMGTAYNLYHVEEGDPAAFVHNRYYVKRVLYDSIDWLDDNLLNNSAGATITALCGISSPPAWCDGAKSYLLPHGVTGGGDERP